MSIEFEGAPYIHRSEMATDDMKIAALRAVNQAIRRYRRPPIDCITKRWKRRFERQWMSMTITHKTTGSVLTWEYRSYPTNLRRK